MVIVTSGTRGEAVRDVQARLASLGFPVDAREHGVYGPSTEAAVREFQQRRQLLVDGVIGDDTWAELVEAGYALGDRLLYLRYPYFRGDDVRDLQARMNILGFDVGREDGIFGERTDRGVRDFQRNVGQPVDGIVGSTTLEALGRLRPVGPGPGRAQVREGEALRQLATDLHGIRVAIDAAPHPEEAGRTGPTGLAEGAAAYDLAEALVRELRARGAEPALLRARDHPTPQEGRARVANQLAPEVLLSIHLNAHEDPRAEGATAFYYGRDDYESQAGHRLADVIQSEVTAQLGLKDGRTHPKSLPLLRETRMPAVHLEPCFITNPHEERLLRSPTFRARFAGAVADALERFFRQGQDDAEEPLRHRDVERAR